jgi:hypothetical protein
LLSVGTMGAIVDVAPPGARDVGLRVPLASDRGTVDMKVKLRNKTRASSLTTIFGPALLKLASGRTKKWETGQTYGKSCQNSKNNSQLAVKANQCDEKVNKFGVAELY